MSRPRKLTDAQIADINQVYSTGVSMRQLGFKYGVAVTAIRYHIQRGDGVLPWAGRSAQLAPSNDRAFLENALRLLREKEAQLRADLTEVTKTIRVKEKMLSLLDSLTAQR